MELHAEDTTFSSCWICSSIVEMSIIPTLSMSALPRASSGAMGGAGIWIQMNVPFVESEFGNVIAPKSSGKLDDLVVFDSATDILMAEG
ncbi:hypothetical protein B7P43_G07854 [Cryptotermes secundus]|uniref:Uncharacterized protein n=1 Tax=Cryptotermes secundus TaxID=105785 RepID=A0A2J7QF27_9NEOP|nr:hypothetical protein B7P43_G07854 [Cryptotermes secundus]